MFWSSNIFPTYQMNAFVVGIPLNEITCGLTNAITNIMRKPINLHVVEVMGERTYETRVSLPGLFNNLFFQ